MTGNPWDCRERERERERYNLTKKIYNISIGVFYAKIFLYEIFLQKTA